MLLSFLVFVERFSSSFFQLNGFKEDVDATKERTELREKFIRKAFFDSAAKRTFVRVAVGALAAACEVETFSSFFPPRCNAEGKTFSMKLFTRMLSFRCNRQS